MNYLERIACRFLIWRFKKEYGYSKGCRTIADWEDGEILHDGGCMACKASFVRKFLQTQIDLLNYK